MLPSAVVHEDVFVMGLGMPVKQRRSEDLFSFLMASIRPWFSLIFAR